ncbi:hypothetical protein ACPOL_6898 (plasmid) [Acidisarcina polymorpha]|uniref:Cytochrome c domain-containing protein n=1 Tax=Acidisarcina polymorpha TaxID=2211140 RepID=A0A2Z5GBR0_9BACT|nr:hypothetical protein [Acidisarcina polymorpha]AXC16106.1 hypothetical protein ACPOL_6898 [Acidisarcina polymorpha]
MMRGRRRFEAPALLGVILLGGVSLSAQAPAPFSPVVPRTWDDAAMATLEIPLANPIGSPRQASAEYYYKIPVRKIYKEYPVYAPGREPAGYMDWLRKQEPFVLWDDAGVKPPLKTEEEWLKAGELVFDASIFTESGDDGVIALADVHSKDWNEKGDVPVTKDGVVPFVRYVIKEKGKVELGSFSCGMCHTRVTAGGMTIKGAQGNFSFSRASAYSPRLPAPPPVAALFVEALYGAPWLSPDPGARQNALSPQENLEVLKTFPPGVIPRHRSSSFDPVQVPDLIGVKDRRYLDRTGLQPQRSIVDLMRYAALNQGGDSLASFDGFIPAGIPAFKALPDPADPVVIGGRYSDEQLYAMALYVYSIKPPPNPNKMDASAVRGSKIFSSEGCSGCHSGRAYTNNKLTPARGFTIPRDHLAKYDILPMSVDTDPGLATQTRRGTGYYKVPSLRGVWYRSMFGHSGWCATLEDWFDPARMNEDYVPTGFKPYGAKTYAVRGHPFGLGLSPAEKKDLIAFLRTL